MTETVFYYLLTHFQQHQRSVNIMDYVRDLTSLDNKHEMTHTVKKDSLSVSSPDTGSDSHRGRTLGTGTKSHELYLLIGGTI